MATSVNAASHESAESGSSLSLGERGARKHIVREIDGNPPADSSGASHRGQRGSEVETHDGIV